MKKLLLCLLLLTMGSHSAYASDFSDASLTVDGATIVIEKLMASPDSSVPLGLMHKAKAVIIIPSMLKGGFILGASYGNGVALIRQPDGQMGPPLFFNVGGASVGLQIGGQASDMVLVVASERGLQGLLKNKMTLGTDLSVTAGPIGRQGTASISGASSNADLYSYSSTAGLFAGISLDGTGLSYNSKTTAAYYGKQIKLPYNFGALTVPESGQRLMRAINKYM